MKILDKAAKLERALLDKLPRRSGIARHPLEIYRAILDDLEDVTEPGTRGSRLFPYNRVRITLPTTDAHQQATTEAVFAEPPAIEERVRARLRQAGCRDVDDVAVTIAFVDAASWTSAGRDYHIDCSRHTAPLTPARKTKVRAPEPRELHLQVLAGAASRGRHTLSEPRINLGRLENVLDRQQRVIRHNHVAFVDRDEAVNQSVSRAHAHIRFDSATGDARLHDDGSTLGTRVVRGGRTLEVPRGERGLALRDDDEILLGQARLRVQIRAASTARKRA